MFVILLVAAWRQICNAREGIASLLMGTDGGWIYSIIFAAPLFWRLRRQQAAPC